MTDLRTRFRTLEAIEAPDLWSEATTRAAIGATQPVAEPSRFAIPMVAAAAVIVTALIIGVVRPWQSNPGLPGPEPSVPTSPSDAPLPSESPSAEPTPTFPTPSANGSASGEPMVLHPETTMRSTYPPGDYLVPMSYFWMHDVTGNSVTGNTNTRVELSMESVTYEPGPDAARV